MSTKPKFKIGELVSFTHRLDRYEGRICRVFICPRGRGLVYEIKVQDQVYPYDRVESEIRALEVEVKDEEG